MKTRLRAVCLGAALAFIGSTITPAMADEWNKETRIEINEPLEIPGRVLQPGTYIFKLIGTSDRNVVEILSEDAKGNQTLVTTLLTVSAYEMDTPDKPIIRLEERPSGSPQAISSWFYPGDNYGWQFVYPKSQRLEVSANQAPAEASTPAPPVQPALPEMPVVAVTTPATTFELPVETPVEEQTASQPATTAVLVFGESDRMLPETAGYSTTELAAGALLVGFGLVTLIMARRKAEA